MNKYIVIVIVIILILLGGAGYRMFFSSGENAPIKTGIIKIVPVTSTELRWEFDPEFIEVEQGDHVVLEVINEDAFDHGFAIDAYGISQRMPAGGSIVIEFDATKAGDFPFYCSVSCGSGIVDGVKRGHFDHIGKMHVQSLISETTSFKETLTDEEIKAQARRASAINEAETEAVKLGYADPLFSTIFDDNNEAWNIYVEDSRVDTELLKLPPVDEYQVVYFENPKGEKVLWIFLDAIGGEIITFFEEDI